MKLVINKDRSVIPVGTWGTKNENDYEILEFEFPEELENYNKRIVYYLDDTKPWDAIVDNKAYITNAITSKENVKAYIWCTKENSERPADTDFRSQEFEMHFYENENADGIVPTPVQVDGFNTMLTAMNAKIDEVDALEQTIETAEAERQENENTRISNESTRESNESTRQTNEETRQTQEADRERRTDEAIADIEDKTAEYNANAEEKTNDFNQNATQKTNDFNSNYTQKVNDFNTNASTQTSAFNSNASSKTSAFNSNAETKTNAFNTNATNKTNDFNNNATEKTTAFDNNASTKTSEFNTNAESKTTEFNTNVTSKTNDFNDNAAEKTTAFNENAQEKIDEYDEHIVEYQAQIDELQEEVEELSENMPWNTTEQATEISVDDAAKYSRNKLELFGNTEQTQYTGVQLLDMSDAINGYFTSDAGGTNTSLMGFHTQQYIDVGNSTSVYGRFEALANIKIGRFWIQEYDENYNSLRRTLLSLYDRAMQTKEVRKGSTTLLDNTKFIRISAYGLRELVNEEYVERNPVKDTWNDMIKATISFSDVDIYEPYVGGQPSPNPDYPQDIHTVNGVPYIFQTGKNLVSFLPGYRSWRNTNIYVDNNLIRFIKHGTDGLSEGIQTKMVPFFAKAGEDIYVQFIYNGGEITASQTNYNALVRVRFYYIDGTTTDANIYINRNNYKTLTETRAKITAIKDIYMCRLLSYLPGQSFSTDGLYYNIMITKNSYSDYLLFKKSIIPINLTKTIFDKNNMTIINGYIDNTKITIRNNFSDKTTAIKCKPNTTYIVKKVYETSRFGVATYNEENLPIETGTTTSYDISNAQLNKSSRYFEITTDENSKWLLIYYSQTNDDNTQSLQEAAIDTLQVYEKNSGIEMLKIGDYQDKFEFKDGQWVIPNKIKKIDSYNGEEITTDYISTTGGLDVGATVYYVGNEDYVIEDSELINELNIISKLQTNKNENYINIINRNYPVDISEDVTLKPYMQLNYMQDLPSKLDNLDSRLALLE